ncbi:Hypothetical protein D9617_18g033120 [Elsinoe fawcettii]|nr:Hypothetical protein D9617_18g033120 [Elsinoe fawcettii]
MSSTETYEALSSPYLVEQILYNLRMRDLLTSAQRVCRDWKAQIAAQERKSANSGQVQVQGPDLSAWVAGESTESMITTTTRDPGVSIHMLHPYCTPRFNRKSDTLKHLALSEIASTFGPEAGVKHSCHDMFVCQPHIQHLEHWWFCGDVHKATVDNEEGIKWKDITEKAIAMTKETLMFRDPVVTGFYPYIQEGEEVQEGQVSYLKPASY